MQSQFITAGVGELIQKATSSTNNALANTTTIADQAYTVWVAGHSGKELCFAFDFAAEATGTLVIERAGSTSPGSSFDTHETITITAEWFRSWAAGETLLGFYRVFNNSGQNLTVKRNYRVL